MKIEEILPEIRKGRRFRHYGESEWRTIECYTPAGLVNCTSWELEPEITELEVSGWKFKVQSNYGLAIYFTEGRFVGNMTFEHIDEFHAFSLKARGIEPQYQEPDISQGYSTSANPNYDAGYLAGYKVGWHDHLEAVGGK